MNQNIKNMTVRTFIAALIIWAGSFTDTVCAQSSVQEIMSGIYKKYDSLSYITFNVKYTYSTDTVMGNFTHEVMNGSYTMAGKKAKYTIGDIDFLQNDSFLIAVYNNNKFIMVSDPNTINTGSELPMRSVMDSMIQAYSRHYTINSADIPGRITFDKADDTAQFKKFVISYDPATNYLRSIQYDYEENVTTEAPEDTTIAQRSALRQKRLTIDFSDYRLDNFSPALYSESNYIWFEDGECKPVDKYRDYKIYYSKSPYRAPLQGGSTLQ